MLPLSVHHGPNTQIPKGGYALSVYYLLSFIATSSNLSSDSDSEVEYSLPSNSTAYTHNKSAYKKSKMSSTLSTVEHPITKHCPILIAGDVTPKSLVDLEDTHNEYFIAKETADDDKIKKILGGFKCVHIRN